MQDDLICFWPFPIFFRVLHQTGNKFFTLNQAFIKKHLKKPSSKTYFPVALEQNILDKYNCNGNPANVKDTE